MRRTLFIARRFASAAGWWRFALAITFLFVGATFAWGPMQLLLERNGAFHSNATAVAPATSTSGDDDADVCPAQTAALLNVPLVAIATLVLTPVFGHIADRYGAPVTAIFMGSCFMVGTLILTLATAYDGDWLLYIAFLVVDGDVERSDS